MPYLGNTPTTQNFTSGTDYFNGTGSQTAFTLSRSVVSINDIQAVVNNVVQVPNDAYTLSGTTITFTSAPSAGTQNVYVRYLSTTTQVITPSQGSVSQSSLASNVVGNGPAFNASNTGSQSITGGVATKVILQTEEFDTASRFNNTGSTVSGIPAYAFLPNVAGYYQLNGTIYVTATTSSQSVLAIIYKNGSTYQAGGFQSLSAPLNNAGGQVSSVVYLNGTTDYVELYGYAGITGTGTLENAGALGLKCQLSGFLARAA
jgi:hypothetical protein